MVSQISLSLVIFSILSLAYADKNVRIKPDQGALVVDATGAYPNSFRTISAAVAALHNKADAQKIFIFPSTYNEQVSIPRHKGLVTIQGYTNEATSYKKNQVTITNNISRLTAPDNYKTATFSVQSPNVRLYNLNIANTFGQGAQALAVSAVNTNQGYYGCKFTGFQDTVLSHIGRQIFAKSYISGAVDFIFGMNATTLFHEIDIETVSNGFITANGRNDPDNNYMYVFNKANITGTSGPGSTVLGRPWRPYAKVIFQESYMSDVVAPEGWSRWDSTSSVDHVVYREYKNYGPGANTSERVPWSSQATSLITPTDMFGSNFEKESWVDTDYL